MIAGHESVTEGDVLLDNRNVTNHSPAERGTALMFQNYALFPHMTCLDNVAYPLKVAGINKSVRLGQAHELLAKVNMTDYANAYPEQLSGGQQQRIALARMFLKNPPIIFLDEPTASLDAIAAEQIKQSLDQIKQGRTVIMISHSLSQIIDADYTYVMKEGQIVEHGEHHDLYHQDGTYKEIFDAMAKSLNIEKIAKTFDEDDEENY